MASIITRHDDAKRFPSLSTLDPIGMMRDLMRWDPFRELSTFPDNKSNAFTPNVDVIENSESYIFKADLPGMKEKDLHISFAGNRLNIKGSREIQEKKADEHHYLLERHEGNFSRTFTLPTDILEDKITAEFKDGVLTLMLPKKIETKRKEIEIKIN